MAKTYQIEHKFIEKNVSYLITIVRRRCIKLDTRSGGGSGGGSEEIREGHSYKLAERTEISPPKTLTPSAVWLLSVAVEPKTIKKPEHSKKCSLSQRNAIVIAHCSVDYFRRIFPCKYAYDSAETICVPMRRGPL